MDIWDGDAPEVREPTISTDGSVSVVNASESGIFIPSVQHWQKVSRGQPIGDIVSPATGEILHRAVSEVDGMVFTLREYPVVYAGSLLARILGEKTPQEADSHD